MHDCILCFPLLTSLWKGYCYHSHALIPGPCTQCIGRVPARADRSAFLRGANQRHSFLAQEGPMGR